MFLVELGRFIYWVPVWELLKIFAQNLHIYHRNDSTSACIIYFIYILVLEDVIGSDVVGGFFWPTLYVVVYCIHIIRFIGHLQMYKRPLLPVSRDHCIL